MNQLSRCTRNAIGTLALLLVSAYSYAVDCPGGSNFYYTATGSGTIATTINVAVASNFKEPAEALVDGFVAANPTYEVNLCHESSGTIASSITGGNPYNIALFLSANQGFASAIVTAGKNLGAIFHYANGIPVFLLSPNAYASNDAADYFLTGQPYGAAADSLSDVVLKHYSGTPAASTIALAHHTSAPYGIATSQILEAMLEPPTTLWNGGSYVHNAGTNVTSACSSLISGDDWQCQYNNVDLTLQAIDNNKVTGGFVAYSQVCDSGRYATDRYLKFSSPYYTAQYGVLVDIASGTQETVAANFVTYLDIGSGAWDTFLTNHCYQTL